MSLRFVAVDSAERWEAARRIREIVFCGEQACPPQEEFDEHDETSRHVLGTVDGQPVATARWRTVEEGGRTVAKLERFAVLPAWRGAGRGRALVGHVLEEATEAGFSTTVLHAQAHLESFYASFGYVRVGDVFEEAAIPHVKMVRD